MYASVLFLGVQNAASVQPVVAIERSVFYREKAAGMYSALPYAFAQVTNYIHSISLLNWSYSMHDPMLKVSNNENLWFQALVEIPYIFLQSAAYGILVYAMIGFEWTAAKFFWYFFYMFFTLLYFTFYGMMSVAITPNHHVAAIVAAAFYGIWNLFCGFIVPKPVRSSTLILPTLTRNILLDLQYIMVKILHYMTIITDV